jgi:hypothetical protein
VCSFYVCSQKELFPASWKARVRYIPVVLAVGIGLSINNALAVIEGLFGGMSEFERTPKYRIEGAGDEWRQKRYKGAIGVAPYVELSLAIYFSIVALYALAYGLFGALPFIALFQWGYSYTAGMSLLQGLDWVVPRQQEA